ncbi:MAG: sigma-E processing peptidase SpoIIGA [Oscillospiraceae bacterium]|nr:sigma-E processing peptidase SpoIIGA [Oscillospiraceae bacterium]
MPVYLDVLVVLNFLVDFLLLVGTNRLSGHPPEMKRSAAAAALGGLYAGMCVLPGFLFLAGTFWRIIVLGLMAVISYGVRADALRRGVVFILLSMALGGVAVSLNGGSFWTLVIAATAVCAMCLLGFRGRLGQQYVAVRIGECRFTALIDTGNMLTDPLTGKPVLVVSASIGQKLLNIGARELADPLAAMKLVPGLRLIPFHAVGCNGGVLPVKRFEDVQLGSERGSCLVAFAPNELGQGKAYEALTGGVL